MVTLVENSTVSRSRSQSAFTAAPISRFNFQELADIYNQSRVDYIVPMPMNAKRMEQYITYYHVDLDSSVVVYDHDGEIAGVGMLGLRDDRAWITRLGVVPERRGKDLGGFLMNSLLNAARRKSVRLVQLEVIKGNEPAYRLFRKLGFQTTRELLVMRRPPGAPTLTSPELADVKVTVLSPDDIKTCLSQRSAGASWVDENHSLDRVGGLKGLRVELESGETGWVIFQVSPFQIAYIVLHTPCANRDRVASALLYHLHLQNPTQDTKVENLPTYDLRWPVFQQLGYFEVFRRIEMFKYL